MTRELLESLGLMYPIGKADLKVRPCDPPYDQMSETKQAETQKWTKGSMSAAKQITRSSKLRMVAVGTILREEADKEFCEIISRETKDQEMADLLRRADKVITALMPGVKHLALQDYAELNAVPVQIHALLSTLEKI